LHSELNGTADLCGPRTDQKSNPATAADLLSHYCDLGWPLIALHGVAAGTCSCPKGKDCGHGAGKHPCVGNDWQTRATADRAAVSQWAARWPSCNWGVLTGPRSGVFMIGPDGEKGLEDMADLTRELGDLPLGPWQWSGTSPGYHLVFAWPDDGLPLTNRRNHRGRAIDVRGENGMFVVEPSRNLAGAYRWNVPPWQATPPPCPAPWLGWIRGDGGRQQQAAHAPRRRDDSGRRPDVRDRALAYLDAIAGAVSGRGGHPQTFWAARCLVWGFDLHPDEALALLAERYNPRCRPEWTERELRHKVLQADVVPFGKPRGWLRDSERRPCGSGRTNGQPPPTGTGPPGADAGPSVAEDAPVILITTEAKSVNDQAVAALARHADLYQRAGCLARVVQDGAQTAHVRRAEGAFRILLVSEPTLHEEMAAAATWLKTVPKGAGCVTVKALPPRWAVQGVHQRAVWPGVRELAGIVESPTLRPDGSVLDVPGYDDETHLIYRPSADYPPLPAAPTRDDARRAADELLALVDDFPFAGPEHAAAWLAAVLTVLARPAVIGPCPLFLFDAPAPGSGKTLLAMLVGLITTGRDVPVSELSDENEEVRKTLTAILLEGDRVVLFDNAAGSFGCKALDAVLTGTTCRGRILGQTKRTPEIPVGTVFLASGNNLRIRGDTPRRVVPCRIVPGCERPEERAGFRIPDLKAHVRRNRPALVMAALTVLRAHALAGRPAAPLPAFGSFEEWTHVVRQAIYWATGRDPHAARALLVTDCRGEDPNLPAVLAAWAQLPGGRAVRDGVSARRALELAAQGGAYSTLREALCEWGKGGELPTPQSLGYRLRQAKDRVAGSWSLRGAADRNGIAKWWVEPATDNPGPDGKSDTASAGDAGDAGDGQAGSRGSDGKSDTVSAGDAGHCGGCFRPFRARARAHARWPDGEHTPQCPASPAEPAGDTDGSAGWVSDNPDEAAAASECPF
jgi:hypothetical protein